MSKKNITIASLAAVLILAMSAWAIAGPGYGRGNCGGPGYGANSAYDQLTPEKQEAVDKIVEKYTKQFSELRTQMWTKHATLQAMVNGGEADEAKIGKLTAEVTELRDKMYDVRQQMADELEKETGLVAFGRGGCPAGGGKWQGCSGQGYGKGYGQGRMY